MKKTIQRIRPKSLRKRTMSQLNLDERAVEKSLKIIHFDTSHDLRNSLTTIELYVDLLLSKKLGELLPAQKKALQNIVKAHNRMKEILDRSI